MTAALCLVERALDYQGLDPMIDEPMGVVVAKCPLCRDRTPDWCPLTVTAGAGRVDCQNGCDERRIRDAVPGLAVPVAAISDPAWPGRYEGRVVDLDALLSKPPQPIPWRVHDVVADGTLTIVSGESGAGKSWLVQAFCTGVARGRAVAGLPCVKGTAVYIDAEMGPAMFVDQRIRPTGATAPEFGHVDAMGLDLSKAEDLA